MGHIKSGEAEGAMVHTGGKEHGTAGYFVTPTVFTGVTASMKIMREEIFGPLGAITVFTTERGAAVLLEQLRLAADIFVNLFCDYAASGIEVVQVANSTEYGLAANVFSGNVDRALRVAHQLESGSIWVGISFQLRCGWR